MTNPFIPQETISEQPLHTESTDFVLPRELQFGVAILSHNGCLLVFKVSLTF